jgi:hypothetical protein
MDIPGLELTIRFDCVRSSTIYWERAMSNKFRRSRKDKYADMEMTLVLTHQEYSVFFGVDT